MRRFAAGRAGAWRGLCVIAGAAGATVRHRRSRRLDAEPPGQPDSCARTAPSAGIEPPRPALAALWLAVHLPLLPLEAWRATLPEELRTAQRPLVLLAGQRVSQIDAVAAARGIRVGMKRATALALAADLLPGTADAARDAAALQALAHAALAFTPAVVLEDEATVLLEVQGCLRLFGGLAALARRLRAAIEALAPHCLQLAAAPTPLGAALLARWAPVGRGDLLHGPHATQAAALERLLDDAPLSLLGSAGAHAQALQGMGLQRLGELRALPRAGLARRFGPGLLAELDRAFGRCADPRRWLEPPVQFESRVELFTCAESAEQVLAGASVLLARLIAWARARHGRIGGFTLSMRHEPRHGACLPATALDIELAEPALDPQHLQSLLRERLARVQLAAPTLELELHCRHLAAGAAPSAELFPTGQAERQGLLRLLERLRARLGDECMQCLEPLADHRPERSGRGVPALDAARLRAPVMPAAHATARQRPAWLLPAPQPLATRGALPLLDGHVVQLVAGPERIEAGWWDGGLVARDYFVGQAADGSLVWLWRARLPDAAGAHDTAGVPDALDTPGAAQWFLQGRFA